MSETAPQTESGGNADLPTTPEQLLARFEDLDIAYTLHHHEAVYTVEESQKLDRDIPGTHCRNLFLRDKKKKMYLVVLRNETVVDMKKLQPVIDSDRLSFGSSDRLWTYLGVRPGSVCPFAIINDKQQQVEIILDQSMMETDFVNYHPLINTMTVTLTPGHLLTFIQDCGHAPKLLDLGPAQPDS